MSPRRLPIFPLRLVVFPGTPTPLHIFEPRYRQLLADCQLGDRTFGISPLVGHEVEGTPAPGSVGSAVIIRNVRPLPDGRSNILVMGGDRYILSRYVETDRLYLVADVEPLSDEPWQDEAEAEGLAREVRRAFERFVKAMSVLHDQPPQPVEIPEEPTATSFHVAGALNLDLADALPLLASRSTLDRLDRLRGLMDSLNEDVTRRVVLHQRAKRNGRGLLHHMPDGEAP